MAEFSDTYLEMYYVNRPMTDIEHAAYLLQAARVIRDLAALYVGSSETKMYSPAELGPSIEKWADLKEKQAFELLNPESKWNKTREERELANKERSAQIKKEFKEN